MGGGEDPPVYFVSIRRFRFLGPIGTHVSRAALPFLGGGPSPSPTRVRQDGMSYAHSSLGHDA